MNDDLIQNLVGFDLFRGLKVEDLRDLFSHASTLTLAADQFVFQEGAEERALYVLLEGTVEIDLEVPYVKEVMLDTLEAGSVFGESSFFHAQPHSANARAVTDVTVVRLDWSAYSQLLDSNHLAACRIGANAAEILAAKLQHTAAWIIDLLQSEESQRVRQKFWDFRQSMGHAFDKPSGGGFSTGAGWR